MDDFNDQGAFLEAREMLRELIWLREGAESAERQRNEVIRLESLDGKIEAWREKYLAK